MPSRTQELWIFDKVTLEKQVFGEFENDFSTCLTLDQARDSTKVIVRNFNSKVIEPNTICYMPTLDLWWIVGKEQNTKYGGNYWEHEIQLLGAIEIFAHRDMVNCGFNKDRYTLGTFLTRLASFIDFELPISFDYTYYNQNKKIEYIKTFENFTPLSAIKEMLNGINAIPKMSFTITSNALTGAIISIIPKTGINNEPIDIDNFDEEKEVKTIDRNSYGATVISNAKNCVCSGIVKYPSVGGVIPTQNGGKVEYDSSFIQLPTNVDYVEKITLSFFEFKHFFSFVTDTGQLVNLLETDIAQVEDTMSRRNSLIVFDSIYNYILNYQELHHDRPCTNIINELDKNKEKIISTLMEIGSGITLRNGETFVVKNFYHQLDTDDITVGFGDEMFYKTYSNTKYCMYWKQGDSRIMNMSWFGDAISNISKTIFKVVPYEQDIYKVSGLVNFYRRLPDVGTGFAKNPMKFAVYYQPQVNVKVKVDNDNVGKDTNILNQNGKLVDIKALSKLLLSHSNEIKSEEITRYKVYKSFASVPKIGSVVNNNGTNYIINNLSLEFSELEDNYYIQATITMTREVACKSTMISGNKNIRDYDCPQNYNIEREQMYRDYFEFSYRNDTDNVDTYSVILDNVMTFGNKAYMNYANIVSFLKVKNSLYPLGLYFKKENTTVSLGKSIYSILDFGDNNIIGYNALNSSSPTLNVLDLFTVVELYGIPISYTDSLGETTSITIKLIKEEDYFTCVKNYYDSIGEDENVNYFNLTPIIPYEMYNNVLNIGIIDEQEYNKDGLEKPKFEFTVELNNANGIIVSNNIFDEITCEDDEMIVYYYVETQHIINEDNTSPEIEQYIDIDTLRKEVLVDKACVLTFGLDEQQLPSKVYQLNINFKNRLYYHIPSAELIDDRGDNTTNLKGKNIAIFCAKVNVSGNVLEQKMIIGINNVKNNTTSHLNLYLNNYKLK